MKSVYRQKKKNSAIKEGPANVITNMADDDDDDDTDSAARSKLFEQTAAEVCVLTQRYLPRYTAMLKDAGPVVALHADLPDIRDPDTADRVLQIVLDTCPPQCAWMVAVLYDRVGSLFRMVGDTLTTRETFDLQFLYGAIKYQASRKLWSPILAIFDHRPEFVYSYHDLISSYFHWSIVNTSLRNDPQGVELFEKLTSYAARWDPEPMDELVRHVLENGLVEQWEVLVYSPHHAIRKAVPPALSSSSFMSRLCNTRLLYRKSRKSRTLARLNDCFMVAARAGVLSALDPAAALNCVLSAVLAHQLDLVMCLHHHCGSLNNCLLSSVGQREIMKDTDSSEHSLALDLNIIDHVEVPPEEENDQKPRARGIKRFLIEQASSPSPLKKMCLQHVSLQVGWGHGREENIRELDIPVSLKDELLFKGLEKMLKRQRRP